jgi:N-acyl-D-aspartate/D-glutamate deacylase
LGCDVRFQALAEPFLVFADGVVTPFFEEFPSGVRAISATSAERRQLFADSRFRDEFRRDWEKRNQRVYHRDLGDMWIVDAPDKAMIGKSFGELAAAAKVDAVTYFMDAVARYDDQLRWKAVAANDRIGPRKYLLGHRYTLPGFNDSGAHARNMAFHDGAISLLRQAAADPGWLSIERAVHRLTRESAEWFGLDAGTLDIGRRADVVVLDPAKLAPELSPPVELNDPRTMNTMRMVKRSDGIVETVIIGGKIAFQGGAFSPDLGRERYGQLLRRR